MYNDLLNSGYSGIQLVGIGKSTHLSSLDNWTSDSDVGVCADVSPYTAWQDWGAAQRDLFILNSQGGVEFHENIGSGFDEQELSDLIISLIPETATCDEIEEIEGRKLLGGGGSEHVGFGRGWGVHRKI